MTPIPAGWKPRLSCPFCGSTCLFTVPDEHGSGGQWVPPIHVGCNDCQAEQVADTEDEAVERWNRRSAPASVAPGDAQDERQGWMECERRSHMVTDNLRFSASHMRDKEHRYRTAYQQEYMGAPMRWLADVYAEASAVFEAKLAALAAQVPQQGEA